MKLYGRTQRKVIGGTCAAILLVMTGSVLMLRPTSAHAKASAAAPVVGPAEQVLRSVAGGCQIYNLGNPCEAIADSIGTLEQKIIGPALHAALFGAFINIVTFIGERLAYEAAVWIGTGGQGNTPLLNNNPINDPSAWAEFGGDIVASSIGELGDVISDEFDIDLDLCSPQVPNVRLGISIGLRAGFARTSPPKPRCTFRELQENWEGFVASAQESLTPSRTVLTEFAKGLEPSRNSVGASLGISLQVNQRVYRARSQELLNQVAHEGFKDVIDKVTGKVKTPAVVVREEFLAELRDSKTTGRDATVLAVVNNPDVWLALLFHIIGVFTQTLVSEGFNTIYTGLFEGQEEPDPFDPEAVVFPTREEVADSLSGLLTAQPVSVANYNILGEFVTCPIGSGINRTINQCVFDTNLLTAIEREMTVGEAMDEENGFLNGDFPLISPDDEGRNQDPFCYTYGFCYSNLVKMRKARILPVGWELAALKSPTQEAVTLREVVAGFADCPTGKWCGLIDPNWVLKYPETSCKALVNGEQLISPSTNGRNGVCVDTPSCISENADGECVGGFGYCTREKNVWQFRGDSCSEQFAGCLALTNTTDNQRRNYLLNTVDFGGCTADSAGCYWNRTNKAEQPDGSFDWPDGFTYTAASWDAAVEGDVARGATPTGLFAHEDRAYYNRTVERCDASAAGCTQLFRGEGVTLNHLPNPGFEEDLDANNRPDGWDISELAAYVEDGAEPSSGSDYLSGVNAASVSGIRVVPNAFYTISFDGKGAGGDSLLAEVALFSQDGAPISAAGLSAIAGSGTACATSGNAFDVAANLSEGYSRYSCTITTPADTAFVNITFTQFGSELDNVQFEFGELATDFVEGYRPQAPNPAHLKVAPDYLGCEGKATDPVECNNYARQCSALDVGCNLYTPEDGDPAVSAVISDIDRCPAECVGYDTFKQEETKYAEARFPLFFIPSQSQQCPGEDVGCDSFTNLDALEAGGEGIEYYTDLRACLKPEDADTGIANRTPANYFTWEGSETQGYQLMTWQLLKSELSGAPCVNWEMQGPDVLVCVDSAAVDPLEPDDCNEHSDIFTNGDCREFYDDSGEIHYREFSGTVTISSSCHPYRKTVSTAGDCAVSGGFFTAAGECRYFGLPEESVQCPATSNGCREYTGGAGRNAVTILDDDMEAGVANWENVGGAPDDVLSSPESLAAGGRSMQVDVTGAIGKGAQVLINEGDDPVTGPLVGSVVPGKTFVVEFWAKGGGDIDVFFTEEEGTGNSHDFTPEDDEGVDPVIELTNDWQLYRVGPLDTSVDNDAEGVSFADFDDTAVVEFLSAEPGTFTFFIDNVRIKQVEENITLIQDSWVVPSTCDTTPPEAGSLPSPQFYLGCEAYTDRGGVNENLYQFTRTCSGDAVGCEQFFDTQNSVAGFGLSPNGRTVNATCAQAAPVGELTTCSVDGVDYCTITPGNDSCLFTIDSIFARPLPSTGGTRILLGPEAREISNDMPIFLVDDGSGSSQCFEADMGCTEVGRPKYNQDKTEVTDFESAYYLDRPDEYDNILCSHDKLFCQEWESSQDGNFYFKDPIDQVCEYKTGVEISGATFFGWFKKGTQEPCDPTLLVGGNQYDIWQNGDVGYDGWVGECPPTEDGCTAFIDPADTQGGATLSGKPYYFVDDEGISEDTVGATQQCQGRVSQNFGCGLFDDSNIPQKTFNAAATYTASNRADVLFGGQQFEPVDPISCLDGGGIIDPPGPVESIDLCAQRCAYNVGDQGKLTTTLFDRSVDDDSYVYVDSCVDDADCSILQDAHGESIKGACVNVGTIDWDGDGTAEDGALTNRNDTNRIIKVRRDRECAEWLSCSSSRWQWNPSTSKFEQICEQLATCTKFSALGSSSFCTEYKEVDPVVLSESRYKKRDLSWAGLEYSGYSIPNQLPVAHYDQFDLSPAKVCIDDGNNVLGFDQTGALVRGGGFAHTCSDDDQCEALDSGSLCKDASDKDFRLVHAGGSCEFEEHGESCTIGVCEISGVGCTKDEHCNASATEECIHGYCQFVATGAGSACTSNADCEGTPFPICDPDQGSCVNQLKPNGDGCKVSADCGVAPAGATAQCTPTEQRKEGICLNRACLTSIDGKKLVPNEAILQECRGYPEPISPFPNVVTTEWGDRENLSTGIKIEDGDNAFFVRPFESVPGFDTASTCSPYWNGNEYVFGNECQCDYEKAEYGDGTITAYFPLGGDPTAHRTRSGIQTGTPADQEGPGLCSGGSRDGLRCSADTDCGDEDGFGAGTCLRLTAKNTVYGWHGFCIESDTAIHINGQAENEHEACLNWLPIDRLSGTTDLFAQNTGAGYDAQDTYYCAETELVYNLHPSKETSLGHACAESLEGGIFGGDCQDEDPTTAGWDGFDGEDCWKTAWCPPGYFGVITGCGDAAPQEQGGPMCGEFGFADNDCPFFCVPIGSYHTTGERAGEPCLPPSTDSEDAKTSSEGATPIHITEDNSELDETDQDQIGADLVIDFFLYRVLGVTEQGDDRGFTTYKTAYNNYQDCRRQGLPLSEALAQVSGHQNFNSLEVPYGENSSNFFRRLFISQEAELACKSLVQVASEDRGTYNQAWSDRTWYESGLNRYRFPGNVGATARFQTQTTQVPFGKATDPQDHNDNFSIDDDDLASDALPQRPLMCVLTGQAAGDNPPWQIPPEIEPDACPAGYELDDTNKAPNGSDPQARLLSADNSVKLRDDVRGFCLDPLFPFPEFGDCTSTGGICIDIWCEKPCATDFECASEGFCSGDTDTCVGGALHGKSCGDDGDCRDNFCVDMKDDDGTDVRVCRPISSFIVDSSATYSSIIKQRLGDVFATSHERFWRWDAQQYGFDPDDESDIRTVRPDTDQVPYQKTGRYVEDTIDEDHFWRWNRTHTADSFTQEPPEPPQVYSVHGCFEGNCDEGTAGAITVNESDFGNVTASARSPIVVKFFAGTAEDQLPLRNILVDWGDAEHQGSDADDWPIASISGSTDNRNFYKAHRGIQDDGLQYCQDSLSPFGEFDDVGNTHPDEYGRDHYGESCDASFISFQHDYVCTVGLAEDLANSGRFCVEVDGELQNSPCTGSPGQVIDHPIGPSIDIGGDCVFQPRVHVRDNWGWCTGNCPGGFDGTDGCYDASQQAGGGTPDDECRSTDPECPGPGCFGADPWIYYDGFIVVTPS